jgi:hypothetical protein
MFNISFFHTVCIIKVFTQFVFYYSGSNFRFKNCTNGEIRLTGGPSSNKGRLEVCRDSTWTTVCDSFGIREGVVTCRQLGYQSYGILDSVVYRLVTVIISRIVLTASL